MPLGFSRHPNRSSQALDNPHPQRGSFVESASQQQQQQQQQHSHSSGGGDQAYDAREPQSQSYLQTHNDDQSYNQVDNHQDTNTHPYQNPLGSPVRSQSQRFSPGYNQAPELGDTRPDSRPGTSDHNQGQLHKSYSIGPGAGANSKAQQPPPEHRKSKSRFFKFSSKSHSDEPPTTPGLSRRLSKRHNDSPPEIRGLAQDSSLERLSQHQDWQSIHDSDLHLASAHERDERDEGDSDLDPFLNHQQDLQPPPAQTYDPRLLPPGRLTRGDQDLTLRVADEDLKHMQYQQQQQQQQQQQRAPQPPQHLSQSNTPVSPTTGQQAGDYLLQTQLGQFQLHPGQKDLLSANSYRQVQNPEVISQLSHDSPIDAGEDQRPISIQTTNQVQSDIGGYSVAGQEYTLRTTSNQAGSGPIQGSRLATSQTTMAPPPTSSTQTRKALEGKQNLQAQPEPRNSQGPPPGYNQQPFSGNQAPPAGQANSLPSNPAGSQGGNYRGSGLQREYGQGMAGEQGRSASPLPETRELSEMDKLAIKYKKVKGLYFEKQAQVEQLQNTLANQRLSQSRTHFDDNEYVLRFNRLDGAIKEIAFGIRKDWKVIPTWLVPYVNQDARMVGTKEMTAMGRATISRFIADEIFGKCFHPGLDFVLSAELKDIEQHVRLTATPATNQEEAEALNSRIVQWKLTTVDGLNHRLNGPLCNKAMAEFTKMSVSMLTAYLLNHLQDVSPQELEGNATSIIELAVSIASHLPKESRDITITYPLPRDTVLPYMKVEPALPALDNPGHDSASEDDIGSMQGEQKEEPSTGNGKSERNKLSKKQDKSKGLLSATSSANGKKLSVSSASSEPTDQKGGKDKADETATIRFAGFMGVEVRGRQWLVNPPVWTIS